MNGNGFSSLALTHTRISVASISIQLAKMNSTFIRCSLNKTVSLLRRLPVRTMVNLTAIAAKNSEAEKTLQEVQREVSKRILYY